MVMHTYISFFYLGGGKSAIAGLGLLCLSFKRIGEKLYSLTWMYFLHSEFVLPVYQECDTAKSK